MKSIAKHFVPNSGTLLILGLFLLAQSVAGSPSAPFLSQAPSATLISYQGRLADAGGNPLTGDYQMQFVLYDVPAGGSACWSETQTVSVSDGLFNVLLGSVSAIDPSCLAGDVYLGITVGSDSEMTPRELLASVPFATQALSLPNVKVINGNVGIGTTSATERLQVNGNILIPSSSRFQVDASGRRIELGYDSSKSEGFLIAPGRNLTLGTGWSEFLSLVAGGGGINFDTQTTSTNRATRMKLTSGGNLGVGTTNPGERLEVNGAARVHNLYVQNSGGASTASWPMRIDGWQDDLYVVNSISDVSGKGRIIFRSKNNSTARMVIDGGNVGIGTTSPDAMLDVNGDLTVAGGDMGLTGDHPVGHQWSAVDYNIYASSAGTLGFHATSGSLNLRTDGSLYVDGKIGIGTTNPSEKLHVNGNLNMASNQIKNVNRISSGSSNLTIDAGDGSHQTLTLQDDVRLPDGDLDMVGHQIKNTASIGIGGQGSISDKRDSGDGGPHMVFETDDCFTFQNGNGMRLRICGDQNGVGYEANTWHYFNNTIVPAQGGAYDLGGALPQQKWRSIYVSNAYCGALVESSLQTEEELASERIDRFDEGDLQCWSPVTQRLEKCVTANNSLVQSVANQEGRPIVMGAELVKVIGPVQPGDLLVSSDVPGYAMVNNYPLPGTVIAQALEEFCGEKGIIKAMIRKF